MTEEPKMSKEQMIDALELLAEALMDIASIKEIKEKMDKPTRASLSFLREALKGARWDSRKRKNAWLKN